MFYNRKCVGLLGCRQIFVGFFYRLQHVLTFLIALFDIFIGAGDLFNVIIVSFVACKRGMVLN